MLLRNYWYVAAWSNELSSTPLARTILNEPVVMLRAPGGKAVALQDRCAHRRMPLSKGKVVGDTLVCCYHGLTYDFSGRCVRVPGQSEPPANIRVRSFPAVERYGAVWLWMGEPELADPERIFKCDEVDPGGSGHQFYFHVKASYLYLNDNLSDLLHQAFLHNPSFGGNTDPLGETKPTITQEGDRIRVEWDWSNVLVPGTFGTVGGIPGLADGWNYSLYEPPSFYINRPGFAAPGTGGLRSSQPQGAGKLSFTVHQLITPETERTTHFFKIVCCDWPAHMLPKLSLFIDNVNQEDIWACEEQQKMEDLDPSAPMQAIPTDTPVVKMRHVLQRLYKEEQRRETDARVPA
jgi:phenylpropionate dioxygenase-like ring-hydroxylating dioxygenase large terminal subunit